MSAVRGRRIGAAAAVAAGAAAALAGSTAATPNTLIRMRLGDVIDVLGTKIACQATIGSTNLKGKKLVGCLLLNAKGGAATGTYAPALAADGEIVIVQVSKKAPVVYRRTPSAAGAAGKGRYLKGRVGSTFLLTGTDLGCAVQKSKKGVLATCFKFEPAGGKPRTYGFAMTDRFVAVVKFDAKHEAHVVYTKNQR